MQGVAGEVVTVVVLLASLTRFDLFVASFYWLLRIFRLTD